jgi:hypothetical protein
MSSALYFLKSGNDLLVGGKGNRHLLRAVASNGAVTANTGRMCLLISQAKTVDTYCFENCLLVLPRGNPQVLSTRVSLREVISRSCGVHLTHLCPCGFSQKLSSDQHYTMVTLSKTAFQYKKIREAI